jgi:response regulator RpfG family c-di-GMP phosphodiesterase
MDRVLVVDDETGIRGLVTQWVERLGCVAVEAASAEQAVQALDERSCAIAVCDVNLPGRDGLWLARHIRRRHPETAIVLATDSQDIESAIGGLRAGIVDYLLKPFGCERFREAIERAQRWHRVAADACRWSRTIELEFETRRRHLAEAVTSLRPESDEAVRGLLAVVTVRNRPAFDHALRVAGLAADLARSMGLAAGEVADLERAGLLHEVARTVVPETVLWKPGELTADDWAVLRREPEVAGQLFLGNPFLAPAAAVLRAARERFDGAGYPRGLSGPDIPIGSRILALADAYDTMTRPQGHRDPLTPSDAAREILDGRGTQFDPVVADTLLAQLGHLVPSPHA